MKKHLLFILLFIGHYEIKSQSLMTVEQIFDFNIGDIFIKVSGGFSTPPSYKTMIVTNKTFSTLQDTVSYQFDVYKYTQPACSLCPAIYDTSMYDTTLTNLTDTMGTGLGAKIHYWAPWCIDTAGYTGIWLDSVFYDTSFCSKLITRINSISNGPQLNDSCYEYFEPYYQEDEYGEGIGVRYHHYDECSQGFPNCSIMEHLVFYKKGNDSCGYRPFIPSPNSVEEYGAGKAFTISPNPFSSQAQITFSKEQNNTAIKISNTLGQELQSYNFSGKLLTLERRDLSNGIYILSISNSKEKFAAKLIVQ